MKHLKTIIEVAVCLASCMPAMAQKGIFKYNEKSVTVVEPEAHVATIPAVADLQIKGDRIKETVVLDDFRACRRNLWYLQDLKTIALAKVAEKYDADCIVATSISVDTRDRHFAFTITGYPAVYANFRKPDKVDMDMIWKASRCGEENTDRISTTPRIIKAR